MAEENQLAIFEKDTPLTPIHSQAPTMHALPPHVSPTGMSPTHQGVSPTHLPPPASSGPHLAYSGGQPSSAIDDRARIAILESTVNQLAATMATNMAELMALLKGPNRASSSFTPPPRYGPAVNPSPWAQPTLITDNGDTSAPMIVNTSAAHPVSNLPAPPSFSHPANLSVVTLVPSATMLEPPMLIPSPISTPVPISVSASVPASTSAVPPPIIFLPTTAQALTHIAEPPPYQAPQPHIGLSYQAPPPINIAYSKPGTSSHAAPRAPPTNFLLETGTEQEQRLKKLEENIRALQSGGSRLDAGDGDWSLFPGMAYYLYLLAHTFSFSNLIDVGKKLDIGIKLCKIEGPVEKKEGESSKRAATGTVGSRRGKDTSVNDVNSGCQAPQQYSISYTPAPPTTQAYAPPSMYYQQQLPAQQVYYSTPPASFPSPVLQQYAHNYAPAPPPIQQSRPPASRTPQPLREKIQQMIDDKQLMFNAVKPPNVQSNPLPDHGSSSGPSINMIGVCAIGEYETRQKASVLFVIEYVPAKTNVGVMGVTRSGRVCENPKVANKGKAPAVPGVAPEASSIPHKKVTEEEAEAFMKIIKASEYKVVEQMGKSPAHISLLALLLGSELHREVLLKILTAAQVPKETAPDLIAETVGSIFSNNISFSDDELPSEGYAHSRALHIVCKCNNFVVGRVMIDNGSALNVLDISNAFSLLLGRPWIHSAGVVPSTLHQKLKFIVEERFITVKREEDYAIYKETVVPYISIGDDQNLPFHSFDAISVIRDYGEIDPTRADRMVGRFYCATITSPVPDSEHMVRGSVAPLRLKNTRTGRDSVFALPVTRLLRLAGASTFTISLHAMGRSTRVSRFIRSPTFFLGLHTSLENRQLTAVEPTEEINVGTEEEPRILKIGTGLDLTKRARMIEFLMDYQEVFAWSYANMPDLDPSIVKLFLPLDTERFPAKRPHLRRQRAGLLLRIKEEIIKQINVGFLEVCNYSEWVANIVPVEKKDGRVRVCVDY
ncbi:hypothetical protein CRG98_044549 [Punica granatum]|uniref:Uncharacterized protein n=1 Tax=Punica granatum TaxID=22663 RepID=A0A2I0HU89_PUNGR|nr:hypothetical protein CRG98_044549 [Punica granatum]